VLRAFVLIVPVFIRKNRSWNTQLDNLLTIKSVHNRVVCQLVYSLFPPRDDSFVSKRAITPYLPT
jgi:hypothetical protein